MEININENLRITSDGLYNFIIQERKIVKSSKEGVPDRYEWKDVGYYGKLTHVCTALIDVMALRSEAKTLEDLREEIYTLTDKMIDAVREVGDVVWQR